MTTTKLTKRDYFKIAQEVDRLDVNIYNLNDTEFIAAFQRLAANVKMKQNESTD